MLQAQQQLQPQVRARAWDCGGSVTNMKAIGAQQWLTELPQQFVFPAKQRLVSHQFQSQLNQHFLNQRLCETQSAMASHAWNVCPPLPLSPRADIDGARDILKFEGGPPLDHVDGFAAVEDGFRTSGPHQSPWDVVPSHIPSHQPDQASGLNSDHDVVSTSSTLQSSLVSHSGNSINDAADIWSFLFENQAFMNAHPPSHTSSSGPTQISQDQCSEVAVPSNMPSPYSPSFGTQTGNITSYNKAWMGSPSAAPQNPYNHSWELVNQINQYSQAFDHPQPGLATKYHGLPFKPATSAPEPQPSTETEATKKPSLKGPWFDDVNPRWPDYAAIGMSFSSDSEIASPVSPKSRGVERAMLDKKSFWSNRLSSTDSTSAIPMPMLTHSQASPASDWNDLSSSHPGEQKAPTIESNVGCPQRTLRSHTQNCLATVPPQTTMTTVDDDEEWPASPQHKNNGKKARKDDLLVQWKKAGMSYRQIREKGEFTEAESTLRGRYRTLTKRREERVRKPLWTQTDVRLLREAALLYSGTEAEELEMDVDANKVPWKKVADYIWENGGSYHFGNATCKKRWLKIQGMLAIGGALGRARSALRGLAAWGAAGGWGQRWPAARACMRPGGASRLAGNHHRVLLAIHFFLSRPGRGGVVAWWRTVTGRPGRRFVIARDTTTSSKPTCCPLWMPPTTRVLAHWSCPARRSARAGGRTPHFRPLRALAGLPIRPASTMRFQLEQPLPALVDAKFTAAAEKQSLTFSATEVCVIRTTSGVPFQLRYCPALAKKPAASPPADAPPADDAPKKRFDPFEAPDDDLLVAAVPEPAAPSHILVLNKYPVIRDHLIIATKDDKPQTQLLEQDDLDTTYAALGEWERAKKGPLFAFFNSGEHSGASQPHRHLQFLPVDNMRSGADTDGWDLLVDRILKSPHSVSTGFISDTSIPFAHFASRIPPNASGPELHTIYTALHSTAVEFVRKYIASHPQTPLALHSTANAASSISYNMALTTEAMVIAPRRRGGDALRNEDGSELLGPDDLVELNGTVLAGTLMVKEQEQWDLLRSEPRALTDLLEATGIPWGDKASSL